MASPIILLVEDDENDILFLQHAFAKLEPTPELLIVRDGQAALDYLSGVGPYTNRGMFPLPSILITDLKLPKKTGHEILSWLKNHPKFNSLPVVMLTSSNNEKDMNLADSLGVRRYYIKPFAGARMLEIAKEILECLKSSKFSSPRCDS